VHLLFPCMSPPVTPPDRRILARSVRYVVRDIEQRTCSTRAPFLAQSFESISLVTLQKQPKRKDKHIYLEVCVVM
jgi:hypothetical protein